MPVGNGTRGPITKAIQDVFFSIIRGESEDKWGWLTPIEMGQPVTA
jgi:branched-chain amino acid aminotransferase